MFRAGVRSGRSRFASAMSFGHSVMASSSSVLPRVLSGEALQEMNAESCLDERSPITPRVHFGSSCASEAASDMTICAAAL